MSSQGGAPAGGAPIGGQAAAPAAAPKKTPPKKPPLVVPGAGPDQYIAPSVTESRMAEMLERGVLVDGEEVRAAVWALIESPRGILGGSRGQQKSINVVEKMLTLDRRAGLVGLTSQRLIFYMPKVMGRYEFEAYTLEQIDSVQFTKGMIWGRMDVATIKNNRVVKKLHNDEGRKLVGMIQAVLLEHKKEDARPAAAAAPAPAQDPMDALKMKFVNGEITAEEFEKMKKVLES